MSEFREYMHLERLGTSEVEGILDGEVLVFPKIDGTNASVWFDGEKVCAGSRKRDLSVEGASDNAGFREFVSKDERLKSFFSRKGFQNMTLYGEWLVPHSLKTYRDDAWKRFYVFDVYHLFGDEAAWPMVSYDEYKPWLDEHGLDYIPPIAKIRNPNEDDLYRLLDRSGEFLIKDGAGKGEGLVFKNYSFQNQYGRTTWAKLVTNEFKEKHFKEMGAPEIHAGLMIEERIVEKYCTPEFILKEQAKVILGRNPNASGNVGEWPHLWDSQMIPELLGRVWYEFIREETANFLKEYKNPKINFRLLNSLVIKKTKEVINV